MNTEVKEKNELEEYKDKTFEEIKHIDELGNEYWKWEHFTKAKQK